jgi:asparagine synthase (glutamine-hydrolysing)
VHKLAPGHLLEYRHGQLKTRRYWDLPPLEQTPAPSFDEAAREIRTRIRAAVKSHLIADVPVGAFLSGGVDSATIVGSMVELGVRPKTFSIGFDEREFDELHYARLIARHFDTDHHELVVRPDAYSLLDELAWFLDEPFADASAIPTYLVSRLAASKVKVVLSGDGGDELFAGYDRYPLELDEAKRLDWLPALARRAIGGVAQLWPERGLGKGWLHHAALERHLRFVDGQALFPLHWKSRLLHPDLAASDAATPLRERAAILRKAPGDSLGRLLYFDTHTYLPLDILTKVDRMTMAHSLEARPPLLDHHLVEAAFTLPSRYKLDGKAQKAVMKRAVENLLPREILSRPKRGFGVPLRLWFRGPLKQAVADALAERRIEERGLLDPRAVRELCEQHFSGRRDQSLQLWGLLMLEAWCRRYLDQPSLPLGVSGEVHAHG